MSDTHNVALQWDRNAVSWSESMQQGHDLINQQFGIPFFLQQLGTISGVEVLDAGCGEGRSSRHLAANGAKVTGVDISPGMIGEAVRKEALNPQGIRYVVGSCADLKRFPDESFPLVTSFMALMDTANLAAVLREFSRVLKAGGKLMAVVRHPCFFSPGFSIHGNMQGKGAGLEISNYFLGKPYLETLRFKHRQEKSFAVTRYPYTLTNYVDAIMRSGLTLTSLNEPRPTEEMCRHLHKLGFWRLHAALYLFIHAAKIVSK
jgi:SAM-dependent methyltransferase